MVLPGKAWETHGIFFLLCIHPVREKVLKVLVIVSKFLLCVNALKN